MTGGHLLCLAVAGADEDAARPDALPRLEIVRPASLKPSCQDARMPGGSFASPGAGFGSTLLKTRLTGPLFLSSRRVRSVSESFASSTRIFVSPATVFT